MSKRTPADPGPAPTKADRRELVKRGHGLKAHLFAGRGGLTPAFVQQVRSAFTKADLLKVRIEAEDANQSDLLAQELAAKVPCHLIQRVGRVALLYRQQPETPA